VKAHLLSKIHSTKAKEYTGAGVACLGSPGTMKWTTPLTLSDPTPRIQSTLLSFPSSKPLRIINVYISPHDLDEKLRDLDTIERHLSASKEGEHLILCGDFNFNPAHGGGAQDRLQEIMTKHKLSFPPWSEDTEWTFRGASGNTTRIDLAITNLPPHLVQANL
jgi:endonuclease/exonuclease/phosphatase family metal-dependent hydrolase